MLGLFLHFQFKYFVSSISFAFPLPLFPVMAYIISVNDVSHIRKLTQINIINNK